MDLLLFARYKRGGGSTGFRRWEFSSDIRGWEEAPAPAHVGKRLVEGLFGMDLPDRRAALVNNITHWGYGILNGVPFGIIVGSVNSPRVRYGAVFGASVWATSYAVLPAAKLYQPIWEYDARTLGKDLSAHLLYGLSTAAVFKSLSTVRGSRP
ncbi:hypothetical protein [Marmoricola sp. URHB0036]|uniref:hypothetical protein n=1 Tax=Marmoricola sp. URHB0036 TaxID=1298863 RepID=UPI0012DC05B2|nr:hypothetical protein [Marmoricola sp. URHB0036]